MYKIKVKIKIKKSAERSNSLVYANASKTTSDRHRLKFLYLTFNISHNLILINYKFVTPKIYKNPFFLDLNYERLICTLVFLHSPILFYTFYSLDTKSYIFPVVIYLFLSQALVHTVFFIFFTDPLTFTYTIFFFFIF